MVIVVMGVAGSGKTTVGRLLASRLGWRFADADAYHSEANVAKMRRGTPLTDADRRDWLEALRAEVAAQLERGEGCVLACSALTERARERLRVDRQRVRFVYLEGSAELIRQRMAERRDHFMPAELLDSQFATLEVPGDALRVGIEPAPAVLVERIVAALGGEGEGERSQVREG